MEFDIVTVCGDCGTHMEDDGVVCPDCGSDNWEIDYY